MLIRSNPYFLLSFFCFDTMAQMLRVGSRLVFFLWVLYQYSCCSDDVMASIKAFRINQLNLQPDMTYLGLERTQELTVCIGFRYMLL